MISDGLPMSDGLLSDGLLYYTFALLLIVLNHFIFLKQQTEEFANRPLTSAGNLHGQS